MDRSVCTPIRPSYHASLQFLAIRLSVGLRLHCRPGRLVTLGCRSQQVEAARLDLLDQLESKTEELSRASGQVDLLLGQVQQLERQLAQDAAMRCVAQAQPLSALRQTDRQENLSGWNSGVGRKPSDLRLGPHQSADTTPGLGFRV
jgi:hypothetical protein